MSSRCARFVRLRVEALSGSLSCRRQSSRGKIGQLAEALFGESKIWTNQEKWVWTITGVVVGQSHLSEIGQKRLSDNRGLVEAYEEARKLVHSHCKLSRP